MVLKKLDFNTRSLLRSTYVITSLFQCITELIENSLDANATKIEIDIDFIKNDFQITDNGTGISLENLKIIGNRYVTSKCHTIEDLKHISTYGFRGEALASIFQIADIEIITKVENSEEVYSLYVNDGNIKYCGISDNYIKYKSGTSIFVQNIFRKLPVRQKMLKKKRYIYDNIKKNIEILALIEPGVEFSVINKQNERIIIHTKSSNRSSIDVFKNLYDDLLCKDLVTVNLNSNDISDYKFSNYTYSVSGFIGFSGNPKKYQYIYLNKRYLDSNEIYKLINKIFNDDQIIQKYNEHFQRNYNDLFRPYIPHFILNTDKKLKKYPVFLLNILCSTDIYDVCMDPSKRMVEFENWESILDFIKLVINNALEQYKRMIQTQISEENMCNKLSITQSKYFGSQSRLLNEKSTQERSSLLIEKEKYNSYDNVNSIDSNYNNNIIYEKSNKEASSVVNIDDIDQDINTNVDSMFSLSNSSLEGLLDDDNSNINEINEINNKDDFEVDQIFDDRNEGSENMININDETKNSLSMDKPSSSFSDNIIEDVNNDSSHISQVLFEDNVDNNINMNESSRNNLNDDIKEYHNNDNVSSSTTKICETCIDFDKNNVDVSKSFIETQINKNIIIDNKNKDFMDEDDINLKNIEMKIKNNNICEGTIDNSDNESIEDNSIGNSFKTNEQENQEEEFYESDNDDDNSERLLSDKDDNDDDNSERLMSDKDENNNDSSEGLMSDKDDNDDIDEEDRYSDSNDSTDEDIKKVKKSSTFMEKINFIKGKYTYHSKTISNSPIIRKADDQRSRKRKRIQENNKKSTTKKIMNKISYLSSPSHSSSSLSDIVEENTNREANKSLSSKGIINNEKEVDDRDIIDDQPLLNTVENFSKKSERTNFLFERLKKFSKKKVIEKNEISLSVSSSPSKNENKNIQNTEPDEHNNKLNSTTIDMMDSFVSNGSTAILPSKDISSLLSTDLIGSKSHRYNYRTLYNNLLNHKVIFDKKHLLDLQVIGQADQKFIVCKLLNYENKDQINEDKKFSDLLVLLDQHAIDERIQLEILVDQYKHGNSKGNGPEITQLTPPIRIILPNNEIKRIEEFKQEFKEIGIYFEEEDFKYSHLDYDRELTNTEKEIINNYGSKYFDKDHHMRSDLFNIFNKDSLIENSDTSNKELDEFMNVDGNGSSENTLKKRNEIFLSALSIIRIIKLPRLIVERCLTNVEKLTSIIRNCLYELEDSSSKYKNRHYSSEEASSSSSELSGMNETKKNSSLNFQKLPLKSHSLYSGASTSFPSSEKISSYFSEKDTISALSDTQVQAHIQSFHLSDRKIDFIPSSIYSILCSLACHKAIKFDDQLTLKECRDIVEQIPSLRFPFQCAHGRPTMIPLINLTYLKKISSSYVGYDKECKSLLKKFKRK